MNEANEVTIENIDSLIAELEGSPVEVVAPTETLAELVGSPVEIATSEIDAARAASYAEQEASEVSLAPVVTTEVKVKGAAKPRKVKAVAAASDETAPKAVRVSTADMTTKEALIYKIGTDPTNYVILASQAALPESALAANRDSFLDASNTVAKKVKEKLVNLMDWAINGKALSVYTEIALRELATKGKLTSPALRQAYETNGGKSYSPGTASAQAGQMLQLFKLLQVGVGSDNNLDANDESVILAKFKAGLTA